MNKNKLLILLALLLFVASNITAADFTVIDDKFNSYYYDLELRGLVEPASLYGPLTYRQYQSIPDSTRETSISHYRELGLPFSGSEQMRLFGQVEAQLLKNKNKLSTVGEFHGGMLLGSGRWSSAAVYEGISGDDLSSNYYGYQWRGVKAKTGQVYVRWSGDKSFFQIGKDQINCGLGLTLSGRDPYENIQGGVTLGDHLKLYGFVGKLDGWLKDSVFVNRYLAGHRAEISFPPFQLGFNEYVIYGGPGRNVELYYLIPLYLYQGEQINRQFDDNVIWNADFKIVKPPFRLSGEVTIDDFQIERKTAGDQEPTEAGFGLQADWAVISSPCFVTTSLSYRMITGWTYNQSKDWNRFLFESQPIGSEEGNDFDRLSWKLTANSSAWIGSAEVFYKRKGQGSIEDPWTEPWAHDSTWHETFPTGVVEKTLGCQINLEWQTTVIKILNQNRLMNVFGLWRYENSQNYDNISGQNRSQWLAGLGLGFSFSQGIINF
ncbi:MAG: hypothetical protein KKG02_09980 [Candidatus Edwardsbacteria bacterium]|nr:hypothetical protein [Candidatus Edwardsbacteria bacterium]